MTRKLLAIGGGENGRPLGNGKFALYETEPMDKEIIKLTGKENPNFLFIAHSQASSIEVQECYYQTMKKIYGEKFGCNCQDLKSSELEDIEKVKVKINWADIIYEGGGDTLTMIELWKNTGFDKILYEAWNNGKVICGISAGAVCWFKSCNSDSLITQTGQKNSLVSVDCLGWLNAHLTPHCDETGRYETTIEQLRKNGLIGIMLSNCAALEIIDNQYRMIISDSKGHNIEKAYGLKAYWNKDEYREERITLSNEFEDIARLLNKEVVFNFEEER